MKRVPQELRHPLFLGGTALYLLSVAHKQQVLGPWVLWPLVLNSYLADFLAMPLELTLMLWLMRRFYFRNPSFILPTSWITSTWVVFSLWFEAVLPHFDTRATADPLDVVAYAAGGLVFWFYLNRPAWRNN